MMRFFFSIFCFFLTAIVSSQHLVDYLAEAEKNFHPSTTEVHQIENYQTTDLSFGFFTNPQQTISGAQRAYVQLQQQLPWLGKGLAYRKHQKYIGQLKDSNVKSQLAHLKFLVKKAYYNAYSYAQQKDIYLIYASKLREFVEAFKKDSLSGTTLLLQQLKYEQELVEVSKKMQLVDGEYQKAELHFVQLVNSEAISEINLPLELAMPDEEGSISFSETYENPIFLDYENELLAQRQAQKFNSKWLPSMSLGIRFTKVNALDNIIQQLPNQDIFEPQMRLQWNLFSKNTKVISMETIEQRTTQKAISISNELQILINDQVSARIAYFSSQEKLDRLQKMKEQLHQKNVPLSAEQLIEVVKLKATYQLEEVEAVTNYYISSSKMLLYQ